MSPSLAQMVKKWLKTYSTKTQWDFRYEWDEKKQEDNLHLGYLRMSKWEQSLPHPAIRIEKDQAIIGQFRSAPWDGNGDWTKSIHSDVKLIAADPRFFTKLDRAMQFLTRADKRREENEKKFAQEEMAFLKESLR